VIKPCLKPFGVLLLLLAIQNVNGQALQFYYGNLHAHSSYSDGNKDAATSHASTPYHDFMFGKTAQHFDFLGISEHNHNGAGMVLADYARGLQQADSANADGTFITMYGMEWGVIGPPGGHVLIYGVNQLIGWETISGLPNYDIYNAKSDYDGLFTKVARTPGAFATFAHPENTDYSNLFTNPVNLTYDSAIVGTAIRSGPAFSIDTVYNDASTSTFEVRYKDALKRGYHLGATIDHDNHYTTFGKMASSRTVVLAPSLTRANIMEAFRQRRTQASDDWNVRVTYTINGKPLGTIFTDTINPTISVTVYDPDLEATQTISILSGVPGSGSAPTTLTSSSTGSLNYTHNIAFGSTYYYYAVITQADGDKIFTSPIWISKMTTLPIKLVSFNATLVDNKVNCKWSTTSEINSNFIELERSDDAISFYPIFKVLTPNSNTLKTYEFNDEKPVSEFAYYRLRQVDNDGKVSYSNIASVKGKQRLGASFTIAPNPFDDMITVTFDGTAEGETRFSVFNIMGEELYSKALLNLDKGSTQLDLPQDLPAGIYTLHIQNENQVVVRHILKR
jgi:hypothetical protein